MTGCPVRSKRIAAAGATILFSLAWAETRSPLPVIVVVNSLCHHLLFPDSEIAYWVDMGFNGFNMLRFLPTSGLFRWLSLLTASGWLIGQWNGGCSSETGVWLHVLLCQVPGALASVEALGSKTETRQLSGLQCSFVCAWVWAVTERLLPRAVHDRSRVAWACVCTALGVVCAADGLQGYVAGGSQEERINSLVALQFAHELGSLVVEIAQRKATSVVYCTHHVLYLLMLGLHQSEWHDAEARGYRVPGGALVYTEKDALYLMGCTEISSVFLQVMTLASDAGWERSGLVARSLAWSKPGFALAYAAVRVFWWPVHAWPLAYRAMEIGLARSHNMAHRLVGGMAAACLAGLSGMQLQWGYSIARMAARALRKTQS